MSNRSESGQKAWQILLIGFLIMVLAGLIFSWSIFITPIEKDLGFNRKDTSLVFTISLSISILGQIFAGFLKKKTNSFIVFGIPAVLFFLGFTFAARVQTITSLYLSYGLLVGFGIGMVYNAVLAYALDHFTKNLGLASGLLLMGFGLGGMILGTVAARLMETVSWRALFSNLAWLFGISSIIAAFIFSRKPEVEIAKNTDRSANDLGPREMVKDPSYLLMFLWFVAITSANMIVIGHSALLAKDLGTTDQTAAWIAGLVSAFNGVSRLAIGKIYEIIKAKKLRNWLSIITMASAVFGYLAYSNKVVWLLVFSFVFAGIVNGGGSVLAGAYLKTKYGSTNFGMNLGITNTHIIIASYIGNAVAGWLRTSMGDYRPAILMMLLFSGVALLIVMTTSRSNSKAAFIDP